MQKILPVANFFVLIFFADERLQYISQQQNQPTNKQTNKKKPQETKPKSESVTPFEHLRRKGLKNNNQETHFLMNIEFHCI